MLAAVPVEYQADVRDALLGSHRPDALARECHGLLAGLYGPPVEPAALGQALRDLLLAGGSITGARIRAFVRGLPGARTLGPGGPASLGDEIASEYRRLAERYRAEDAARAAGTSSAPDGAP